MLKNHTSRVTSHKLSLGGAVLAAVVASSCCVGPILLAALGVGGAGVIASLGAYRPYLLGVTVHLLAVGFYLTYRKSAAQKSHPAEDDACGCDRPKTNRIGRAGLWIATLAVVAFGAAPPVIACIAGAPTTPTAAVMGEGIEQAILVVRGIDCEACAAPIRKALARVGGLHNVRLDVAAQTIAVTYEPAPGRLSAYVAALNDLGYEASLSNDAAARRPQ